MQSENYNICLHLNCLQKFPESIYFIYEYNYIKYLLF